MCSRLSGATGTTQAGHLAGERGIDHPDVLEPGAAPLKLLRDRARVVGELPAPALEEDHVVADAAHGLRELAKTGNT